MSRQEQVHKYLTNIVNPVLKPMISQIVIQRPDDIMKFVFEYAKKAIEQCQQMNKKVNMTTRSIESDNSIIDQGERLRVINEKIQKRMNKKNGSIRKGISAEAFGSFNIKPEFVPKVYQKDSQELLFLSKHLLKSFIFQNLSKENLMIVMQAMVQKPFQPKMQVIKEGDNGDMLYIIRSGQYSCTKIINNKPKQLRTYIQGQIFGELSLMYNTKRSASIQCTQYGIVYGLDRATFNNIVQQQAIKTRSEYMNILSKIQILSEIDESERETLCDALKQEKFQANQYVVNQGQDGDRLYFIIEGNLYAEKINAKTNKKEIVYKYKENEYFGEIALIKNTKRQASVKTMAKCRLLSIGREQFKRLLGPIEQILLRNIQKYKKFISST